MANEFDNLGSSFSVAAEVAAAKAGLPAVAERLAEVHSRAAEY